MSLTCPKCAGLMGTYERNGITIDQCTECRGVFLDRGELERLIDAEAAYVASGADAGSRRDRDEIDDDDRDYKRGPRRRRRGFLDDVFDFG